MGFSRMTKPSWIEVSLTVDGELAESVAEVLARYIPIGVVIESTSVAQDLQSLESQPAGQLRVFGYLPVDDEVEETRKRLEKSLWYMGRIRNLPEPQYKTVYEEDWSEAWKKHYRPLAIGQRIAVIPAWLDHSAGGRVQIRIAPGMAFGTGAHPTTQMCLEMIEEHLIRRSHGEVDGQGQTVIDLGCGSGVLSIAALKLGAQRALGVDIDKNAIRSAKENAAINGVEERLDLEIGSLSEIQRGEFSLRQADIVIANILAPVIVDLLEKGLGQLVALGGMMVLSGILEDQAFEVEAALGDVNMQIVERRLRGDWLAIRAAK